MKNKHTQQNSTHGLDDPFNALPDSAWSLDETSLAWLLSMAKAHNPGEGAWTVWPEGWGPVMNVPVDERQAWLEVLHLIEVHPRVSIGTTRTVVGNAIVEAILVEGVHGGPYALALNGYLDAWPEPVWLSSTIPTPIVDALKLLHDLPMDNHLPPPRDGVCLQPLHGGSLPMSLNAMLRLMLDEVSLYGVATDFHMVPCSNQWCSNHTPHDGRKAVGDIVPEECPSCRNDPPETN